MSSNLVFLNVDKNRCKSNPVFKYHFSVEEVYLFCCKCHRHSIKRSIFSTSPPYSFDLINYKFYSQEKNWSFT
jgi:hypothetical protein